MIIRVAHRVSVAEAEGPGRRFSLWVQGCSIHCPGCCNPHYFAREGGFAVEVSALAAELQSVRGDIEGITLLGGEPFEQAEGLAGLARSAHELGLSVMTFTGYTREEIDAAIEQEKAGAAQTQLAGAAELLRETDLLVDGRFDARLPERERRWAGSQNQRFHFLTPRYRPGLEKIEAGGVARTVEIRLRPDGGIDVNGWPELVGLGGAGKRDI